MKQKNYAYKLKARLGLVLLLAFFLGVITSYLLIFVISIMRDETSSRASGFAINNSDLLAPESPELQDERLAQLRALGYIGYTDEKILSPGVVTNKTGKVCAGLNLYNPGHTAEAYLIDNAGKVHHKWSLPLTRAFPDGPGPTVLNQYWRRVRLLDDGDLLAIYEGVGIIRLDKDSNLIWAIQNGAHHDMDYVNESTLAVLRRDAKFNPQIHPTEPVLEDFITFIDIESGKPQKEFSVYTAFADSDFASAIVARPPSGDIFHTNTINVLNGSGAERIPAFRSGNFLISLRELHLIAVVDAITERVVWTMTGQWKYQHEPQMLSNGHILIFDNQGHFEFSKIIEFDPVTQQTVWGYYGDSANDFVNVRMGSQQLLPNGNILITESYRGRVGKITSAGEEVWRFNSPHTIKPGETDAERLENRPGYVKCCVSPRMHLA
ncbi:MAG: hypothetical protein JXX14_24880 [Deltaproteobacteria bacterium]|nr:hypothetical protein [Deltaproteobacteria bacterium]